MEPYLLIILSIQRCYKPHVFLHYPFTGDGCTVAGCYATYVKYDELKTAEEIANVDPGAHGSERSFHSSFIEPAEHQLNQILAMKDTWLAFLIISAVTLVIVLLLVIFLRSRIRIAVALIKEASK
jgi:hypothetical protein